MKGSFLNRIKFIGFVLNLILIAVILIQFILIVTISDIYVKFYKNNFILMNTILTLLSITSLFFFIYNVIFLYKQDRYSKSLIPLLLFNILYSPFYYYKVNFKGRKLDNEMKGEPVLGNTIHLEGYNNDLEFDKDFENLRNKFGG